MKKFVFSLSSLSHKYVMALAGAFLMVFLVVHLTTNLLMLVGREAFDQAANFLRTNTLIKGFEYALFAGFLIHILLGVIIWIRNTRSRPVKYHVRLKTETAAFSKFMIHTGAIIFVFLVIHLINFYFVRLGLVAVPEAASGKHDFFTMAAELFGNPWYSALYIVCFVFLGFHLNHAFQSAFQSLGLNHNKYFRAIQVIGTIYAIVIFLGFSIIPIYFLFIYTA